MIYRLTADWEELRPLVRPDQCPVIWWIRFVTPLWEPLPPPSFQLWASTHSVPSPPKTVTIPFSEKDRDNYQRGKIRLRVPNSFVWCYTGSALGIRPTSESSGRPQKTVLPEHTSVFLLHQLRGLKLNFYRTQCPHLDEDEDNFHGVVMWLS